MAPTTVTPHGSLHSNDTLHVWDLLVRDQDPLFSLQPAGAGVKLTHVLFHPHTHAIAVRGGWSETEARPMLIASAVQVGTEGGEVIMLQLPSTATGRDAGVQDLRSLLKLHVQVLAPPSATSVREASSE